MELNAGMLALLRELGIHLRNGALTVGHTEIINQFRDHSVEQAYFTFCELIKHFVQDGSMGQECEDWEWATLCDASAVVKKRSIPPHMTIGL